jgi:hypothetical protein
LKKLVILEYQIASKITKNIKLAITSIPFEDTNREITYPPSSLICAAQAAPVIAGRIREKIYRKVNQKKVVIIVSVIRIFILNLSY